MRKLADDLRPRLPATHMLEDMHRTVPELAKMPVEDEDLRRIVEAHLESYFRLIVSPGDAPAIPVAASTLARDVARWGAAVETLLKAFHAGHQTGRRWLRREINAAVEDPELRFEISERFEEASFVYTQVMMQVTVDAYADAKEAATRGLAARQLHVLRSIVDETTSADVHALSARLGYELNRAHVGMVVWADRLDASDADPLHLERAVRAWLADQGVERPLTVPVDGRSVWAWASTNTEALAGGATRPPSPLCAAIGQPGQGLAGFRDTHREAVTTRRLARDLGINRPVVRHAELATTAMLDDDLTHLRRYVAQNLGGLSARSETASGLRDVLRVYLKTGERASAAAAEGHLHRNTVARRVEAAVERRGRPLDDDRLGLMLALEIVAVRGDDVLDDA